MLTYSQTSFISRILEFGAYRPLQFACAMPLSCVIIIFDTFLPPLLPRIYSFSLEVLSHVTSFHHYHPPFQHSIEVVSYYHNSFCSCLSVVNFPIPLFCNVSKGKPEIYIQKPQRSSYYTANTIFIKVTKELL
jgi:hypothetical protein